MMQILTLGPALLSVIKKNELIGTENDGFVNGLTSIAIAMAAGVLVIQIGNDGATYFGQMATMFHLTLKKIPPHVFAVMYLLHGFSFGFWMLENRLTTGNEEQDFTDYFKSIISVFSMAFAESLSDWLTSTSSTMSRSTTLGYGSTSSLPTSSSF